MALVTAIYKVTAAFPAIEQFGLISQLRRASVSIPSNIAEGYGRRSHKEYLQFYAVAYGSALEIETQLLIARNLDYLSENTLIATQNMLSEIIKMLYVMVYRKEEKQRIENSY